MSLYERKEIPELYELKHRNDKPAYRGVDYESFILKKTMSTFEFQNDNMNQYLLRFQKLISIIFDQINIRRNFKNYLVDKYYNKHID